MQKITSKLKNALELMAGQALIYEDGSGDDNIFLI